MNNELDEMIQKLTIEYGKANYRLILSDIIDIFVGKYGDKYDLKSNYDIYLEIIHKDNELIEINNTAIRSENNKYTNYLVKFIPKHIILEEYQFNYILDLRYKWLQERSENKC